MTAAAWRGGRAIAALAVAVATGALAGPAGAAEPGTGGAAAAPTGGAAPVAAPKLGATPFGVRPTRPAALRSVRCASGCGGGRAATTGALLRLRGARLGRTDVVVFAGADGADDDVVARPERRARRRVDVRVPLGARSGTLTVADRDGTRAAAPLPLAIAAAPAARTPVAGGGPQVEVQVAAPRGFFDAEVAPHVTYVVHGTSPAAVTVEVVRAADGAVVASWPAGTVAPETPQTAAWDGLVGGHLQRAGRYAFRVAAQAPGGAVSAQAPVDDGADPSAFMFLQHVFPVRGPHYYGEGAARFGGGRGHQGQDVFATCGTPVVAARGGTVQYRGSQSAAGNYLVIDGARTGRDYAYMHLREPALPRRGARVRTGELIGYVGDTGRASACHLHFELWTAPGWYTGGAPRDPLPALTAWDRRS